MRIGGLFGALALAFLAAPLKPQAEPTVNEFPINRCPAQNLVDGSAVDFKAYAGRYLYLDFWASWCGPCKASFPFLDELQSEYPAEKFMVIGLSVDEDRRDAMEFAEDHPVDFLLAIDAEGLCPEAFGVLGMPTSYLIGPDGDLVFRHQGFRKSDAASLRKKIHSIVSGD